MKIKIESNFNFNVSSLSYMPNGELRITLSNETDFSKLHYEYTAESGGGSAVEQPQQSLLEYARSCSGFIIYLRRCHRAQKGFGA